MTLGSSPQHFIRPPWVRHIVCRHSESEIAPLPLRELPFPARERRVDFTVAPAALALLFLVAGGQDSSRQKTELEEANNVYWKQEVEKETLNLVSAFSIPNVISKKPKWETGSSPRRTIIRLQPSKVQKP